MSNTNQRETYTVCSWDPLWYRMFHRVIERVRSMNIGQRMPNLSISDVPVLPATLVAGLLSLMVVDGVTHNSKAYDLGQLEQKTDIIDAVTGAAHEPLSAQLFHSPISGLGRAVAEVYAKISADIPDMFDTQCDESSFVAKTDGNQRNLSSSQPFTIIQQLEDRLTINRLFEEYKRKQGLSGEVQEGLLLYAKEAARQVLKAKGVGGMDAYTYGVMKPEVLATIHAIPGLPEPIRDAFPALIGIESNFKIVLTSYVGACGMSQVMPGGGYADFLSFLIGNGKNARDYRTEFPRLIAGLDYVFEDMLHHVEARNLLGFYSGVFDRLDRQVNALSLEAKAQRKQKNHKDADQLEAQAREANHLRNQVKSLKNFINLQFYYKNKNFDYGQYTGQKRKLAGAEFGMDQLMQDLIKDFPDLASAYHITYAPNTPWLAKMDMLDNFKKTWDAAKYHPILNPFIGASEFNFIYFRIANNTFVQETIANLDVVSEEERAKKAHEFVLALSLRSYNAGLSRVISRLNKHKLPGVAQGYVDNHAERNRILQQGHRQLYGENGVDDARRLFFESQLPAVADNYPGRGFYTTDVKRLVGRNTAQ